MAAGIRAILAAPARSADGLDRRRRYPGTGAAQFPDTRRGGGLRRTERDCVRPGTAATAAGQTEGVCRQFPLWADRKLDALIAVTAIPIHAADPAARPPSAVPPPYGT